MTSYSHSRIGTFETCPLQYKFQYIDKVEVKQEDTVETFLGSKVHETLEKLYKDLKFEKLNSLKELLDYYNKIWKENWNENVKIVHNEYTEDNYRNKGIRHITDYYNRYKPFNQGKVIGLETQDMLKLNDEYSFHIRIDRLVDMGNGKYEVHDYKTNNSLPKQEKLDEDRQLAMYSYWVKQQFKDFKSVTLVWHFLEFDKEMSSTRTAKQLEDLKKKTIARIKEVEAAKKFEGKVSRVCEWCAFQPICPLWAHEVKLEEKSANEFLKDSGVKLVNKYVKFQAEKKEIEKNLDKLKEALVEYCKKERISVVVGSDNKITVKDYESFKFPSKGSPERSELKKRLKELKLLTKVLDIDVFALKSLVQDEEIFKKLKKFVDVEVSSGVRVSKK